ncbi:MAG: DUF4349 domain-containing protein [Ruminococcaceae bacterium]|nr:DUF4349 domain-containing protein [Oscillospiraceae bacterium]
MKRRTLAYFLLFALLLTVLTGCASADKMAMDSAAAETESYYYTDNDYVSAPTEEMKAEEMVEDEVEYDDSATLAGDALVSTGNIAEGRKVIRNAEIWLETKEFDASVARLQQIIEELGGYVSRADVYVRNSTYSLHTGNYTVRIPSENFDRFISYREDIGSVSSTNVWTDDVTDTYYDKAARLQSLETKQARLIELLEKAEDMESIIALESELSDTIYEIELLTGSLRKLDNQIAYSTISIYLDEVREVTEPVALPKTLGERMSYRFSRTMENLSDFCEEALIWFVGALPVLVILLVIALIAWIIFRATAPRRAARRAERARKSEEALAKWNATPRATTSPVVDQLEEQKSEKSEQ